MILSEAIENFIQDRQLQYFQPKTIKNYKEVLTALLRFTGDIDMALFTYDRVIKPYNMYLVKKKIAKASVGSYMRHIKAFVGYMEELGIIEYGTIARRIKPPKAPKKNINLLSNEEIKKMFDSIEVESEWLTVRNKCFVALMLDSGLRQEELTKIIRTDVDFDTQKILVHGKGNKDRFVPLGRVTITLLQSYIELCPFDREFLFCDRYGKPITCNLVKKFMSKLKIQTGIKNMSSHKLRHNFATNYCVDGYVNDGFVDNIKLKTIMGHASLQTTEVYMHEAAEIVAASTFRSHLDKVL